MLLLLLLATLAHASLRLPHVLGSDMLLQRDQPVTVWGWGQAGATVKVTLAAASSTAVVSANGTFSVHLGPQSASTDSHTLVVEMGADRLQLDRIVFGDLYACSGQSNMEYAVGGAFNHSAEIADSARYPNLRLYTVSKTTAATPQQDAAPENGGWAPASPQSVAPNGTVIFDAPFSATCYFFGRDLHREIGVPVGLIASSWGGSPLQSWLSPEASAQCGEPAGTGSMYNAMLAPLRNLGLSGLLWYQGEADVKRAAWYAWCFPLAIADWQSKFRHSSLPPLPFLFVQLAPSSSGKLDPYGDRDDDYGRPLLQLRAAQRRTASSSALGPVGMATAVDLGDPGCLAGGGGGCGGVAGDHGRAEGHPRLKQAVGARLVLQARRLVYGEQGVPVSPELAKAVASAPSVSSLTLSFAHSAGLALRNTSMCSLFSSNKGVCCAASPFEVSLDGGGSWVRTAPPAVDSAAGVVTIPLGPLSASARSSAPAAAVPTAVELAVAVAGTQAMVRYGWVDTPMCMLYNEYNGVRLPAIPFNVTVSNT